MESSAPVTYVAWRDPKEGAFTVEVPRGWKVTGGIYRYAPIDVRPQVAAGPSDGSMLLQAGDAALATFAPPGPSSQRRGLHNGQAYSVNGVTYVVMPYKSGEQFSKDYVQSRLGKLHPNLQVTETRDRSELAAQVDRRQAGGQARSSMGETEFTYSEGGKTIYGVCIARTQMIGQGLGAVWTALPCTVLARRAGGQEGGRAIVEHMFLHTTEDPEWAARSQQIARDFSQMVMQNHQQALAEMNRIYSRFTHQLAEDGRVWSNILNNQVDVRSPSTGQTFKADAGHNYYSLKQGSPVGSNQPLPGVIPLEQF